MTDHIRLALASAEDWSRTREPEREPEPTGSIGRGPEDLPVLRFFRSSVLTAEVHSQPQCEPHFTGFVMPDAEPHR
jgi:hypothetical protein